MKLCFYSPYLPKHFGGGEKHFFDVAQVAALHHEVNIAVSDQFMPTDCTLQQVKHRYQVFLDDSLQNIHFITTPLGSDKSFMQKVLWTNQFDGLYYVTDGSLFFSLAKHNYLHVQVPFVGNKTSILQRLKLKNWQHINANSEFTKSVIEREWQTTVNTVIHPMVDLAKYHSGSDKQKMILSVGRFFRHMHSKRQDVLVEIFKQMLQEHPKQMTGWKLVLAGSVEDAEYVASIKHQAKGLPIDVLTDVSGDHLLDLYQSASIYWHAAGYDEDELTHPEKVEHFGISTVEAMAAGAVPLVHFKGGQKEVLGASLKTCGWLTKDECSDLTLQLIKDSTKRKALSQAAVDRAKFFSKVLFEKKVSKLFSYA